jgi:hypothetical protein
MTDQPSATGVHQPTTQRANPDAVAAHIAHAVGELAKIVLGAQPLDAVMHGPPGSPARSSRAPTKCRSR